MSELLLAIDTATSWCGVALYDGALQLEMNWRAERHHSEQLMPAIERALELTGTDRTALKALVVSRGPGSYTGVRVGITIVRALGFALGIPTFGVDALDVLAYPHSNHGLPVRAFLDAGRRRYATAVYAARDGGLERLGALQSVDNDSMAGLITEPTICCGELSDSARDALASHAGEAALFVPPAATIRRSANLAELAWQRWQSGESSLSVTDPIYVSGEQS